MARRLLRLAAIAAAAAQQTQTTTTFQQGAKKEWTFGDNQYKKVRDAVKPRTGGGMEDERWKLDDRSECYSGTDERIADISHLNEFEATYHFWERARAWEPNNRSAFYQQAPGNRRHLQLRIGLNNPPRLTSPVLDPTHPF